MPPAQRAPLLEHSGGNQWVGEKVRERGGSCLLSETGKEHGFAAVSGSRHQSHARNGSSSSSGWGLASDESMSTASRSTISHSCRVVSLLKTRIDDRLAGTAIGFYYHTK